MTDAAPNQRTIDDLLDRAIRAINRGDRATADELAGRILEVDRANAEAEELLAAPADHGELRRITVLFADMVESTHLSSRIEAETYRMVVGRYSEEVRRVVNQHGGHISETKGDGMLVLFGYPRPHEHNVRRAVQAGLDITRAIAGLSERLNRAFGIDIDVRVGIHRGLVYLDIDNAEAYGFAVNLVARICSIAQPGTVTVSEAIEQLAKDNFEFERQPPQPVKGVDDLILSYRAVAERDRKRVSLGPLIGRERELAAFRRRWQEVQKKPSIPPGMAFWGEPGIGKSRLVHAAIEVAQRSDAVVLQLFGSPFHAEVGLHPARKLLERQCGVAAGSDAAERLRLLRSELAAQNLDQIALVPLLAPVLGISPNVGYVPAPFEGRKLQEQIISAVHDYVLACAKDGCGLVVAEDMQWFDPSTADLVRSLLDGAPPQVMVVMTSRELVSLPETSTIDVLELSPLSSAESDDLIAALHPAMAPSERETVHGRCGGVPLYIEEVVASIRERRGESAESGKVPDTLYELLFARLRASEPGIRVVEAAAVIGSQFDHSVLAHVVQMSAEDLDGVLNELSTATVVESVGEGAWRFRHELLREVAAELPPPTASRGLHSRVADALKSASPQGDPEWPLIAEHLVQADRVDDAVSAYQQASTVARHRGALEEAAMYLSRAVTQLGQLPRDPERDRREMYIRLHRGFLASAIEGPGSAYTASDFERCLELGGSSPNIDEMFWTLQALFTYYVSRADLRRAQQIVDSLRMELEGREWWRVEVEGGAGTLSFMRGEFADAIGFLDEAQSAMASRDERDFEAEWFMPYDPIVLGHISFAHSRWIAGDLAGADAAFALSDRRIAELAVPAAPYSACYARWVQAWVYLEAGLFDQASEMAEDMIRQAERHGFDQWAVIGVIMSNTAAAEVGLAAGKTNTLHISDSIAGLVGWATTSRYVGATGWVPWFDGQSARLLIASGRAAEARAQLDLGLQLADETGMRFYDAELKRLRAATHDNPEDRRNDLATAFEIACRQRTPVFALRAALDDYRQRGQAARQAVTDAMAMFGPNSTWPELARARSLFA